MTMSRSKWVGGLEYRSYGSNEKKRKDSCACPLCVIVVGSFLLLVCMFALLVYSVKRLGSRWLLARYVLRVRALNSKYVKSTQTWFTSLEKDFVAKVSTGLQHGMTGAAVGAGVGKARSCRG